MITTFRNVTSLWESHTSCNETQCQCAKAGKGGRSPGAEPHVCWASSSPFSLICEMKEFHKMMAKAPSGLKTANERGVGGLHVLADGDDI